jgi:copper transport protein
MSRLASLTLALSAAVAAPSGAAAADARVAHTQLESSVPAAGDTLDAAPPELMLTFGGLVEEAGALLRLLGPSGRSWALEGARVPGGSRALASPLPALGPGAYRLEWRVISGDGHPISGDFVFFVRGTGAEGRSTELGAPPPPSGEGLAGHDAAGHATGSAAASTWLMATRAGADAAVLLVTGMLLFGAFGREPPSARTATATLGLSAAAPALVSAYAWLWAGSVLGPDAGGTARIDALGSLFTGRALAAELALALLVPWALVLARRPRLGGVFAVAAIGAGAFAGHAASYTPVVSVPASALHQLAAATWLGGLLFLVTEAESPTFADAARRVSDAALAAVAVVAVTGLLQSWLLVDTITRALSTPYGLLLLGKAAGLLGLVAFGAYHRFRVMHHVRSADGAARLSRSVPLELALAVGVVMLAAVLSHVPPNP